MAGSENAKKKIQLVSKYCDAHIYKGYSKAINVECDCWLHSVQGIAASNWFYTNPPPPLHPHPCQKMFPNCMDCHPLKGWIDKLMENRTCKLEAM